jgi:hypothetical protein
MDSPTTGELRLLLLPPPVLVLVLVPLLGSTTAADEEEAQTGEHSKDFQQLRVQPRLRSFPVALIYSRHLQEEEEEEDEDEEDEDPST